MAIRKIPDEGVLFFLCLSVQEGFLRRVNKLRNAWHFKMCNCPPKRIYKIKQPLHQSAIFQALNLQKTLHMNLRDTKITVEIVSQEA